MDSQPKASNTVLPSAQPPEDGSPRSSRRSLLAALVGGLAGLLGGSLARPQAAEAAAGDPLIIGQANNAGSSQTILNSAATGASFTLKTTNTATNSTGIFGWTSQTGSNATRGVYGKADGANSDGVQGVNSGPAGGTGAGVRAIGNNNHGLVATTSDTSANAVRAIHQLTGSNDATAIYGETATSSGAAIWGHSTDTSSNGVARGVLGSAGGGGQVFFVFPIPSAGVYGTHSASGSTTQAAGVWGEAFSPDAAAVRALNWASTGNAYGLLATTLSSSGFAGKFYGNVDVAGTLSKTSGSFKIDHPLDPENKWLYHSFVESPDMMNIYNGNVTTDANGEATVELPAWFGALNRDYRYQLTTIGRPAQAWIASEIANNRFVIKTDQPNVKVSWQVTGIRQDAWANANRIQVEVPKTGREKGKYAHPEVHGKPASMGIDYVESGRAAVDRYGLKKIREMRQTSGRPSA
jgi:hypothetical protein